MACLSEPAPESELLVTVKLPGVGAKEVAVTWAEPDT
jgi:hypothetical protein